MLAEAERQTPELVRVEYERLLPRDARRRLHGGRGVPLPRRARGARCRTRRRRGASIELVLLHVAYARGGLPRFRQESVAAYFAEVEALRDAGLRVGVAPHSVRACPADWLEEIGRYADARGSRRCTFTPTSSRGRSRSASPSTAAARSSCSRARAASASGRRSSTRRTPTARSSTCSRRTGSTICVCPTTEADLGDGFLPAERIRTRGDPALHRLGLERAHRSTRGAPRARGDRAAPDGPPWRLHDRRAPALRLRAGRPVARARVHGRRSRSISGTARWQGSSATRVHAALIAGCGADVVVG